MGILKSTAFFLSVLAVLALACGDASRPPNPTPAEYTVATPTAATVGETLLAPAATPQATPVPLPSGSPVALSLEFASGLVAPGRQFVLEVQVDPGGRGISGVQFDLRFPPQAVEVLDISPGPLVGAEPLEITGPGDGAGVFRYAAARTGEITAPTPKARVATIRLRVLGGVAVGTPLQVRLQDVKVAEPAGDAFRAVMEVTVSPALTLVVTPS